MIIFESLLTDFVVSIICLYLAVSFAENDQGLKPNQQAKLFLSKSVSKKRKVLVLINSLIYVY